MPAVRRVQFGTRPSVQAESTATAKQGDFVSVDYTGTLDDGTVFDTSRKPGRKPLEFVVGGGMVRHTRNRGVEGCARAVRPCQTLSIYFTASTAVRQKLRW